MEILFCSRFIDFFSRLYNFLHCKDSYLQKSSESRFLPSGTYNQTNRRDDNHSHYNFNNGAESQYSHFKQPMPPKLTNGSAISTRKVPALLAATKNAFDRTMFNRGLNHPQQTVTPFYNKYGERSELANFKNLPDLYPIRQNQSDANNSYFPGDSLINGHEHSGLVTSRFGNSMNQQYERPMFSSLSSNALSATPMNRSSNSMSLRANSILSTVSKSKNQHSIFKEQRSIWTVLFTWHCFIFNDVRQHSTSFKRWSMYTPQPKWIVVNE